MVVGKAAVLAAAIAGAVMFGSGVRSDVNSTSELGGSPRPSLTKRLKPLLNEHADLDVAASGFQSTEDFAATVHAARNIRVPFAVLKHLVVDEGKTLSAAIHAAKPNVDASFAADLARSEARGEIAAVK